MSTPSSNFADMLVGSTLRGNQIVLEKDDAWEKVRSVDICFVDPLACVRAANLQMSVNQYDQNAKMTLTICLVISLLSFSNSRV